MDYMPNFGLRAKSGVRCTVGEMFVRHFFGFANDHTDDYNDAAVLPDRPAIQLNQVLDMAGTGEPFDTSVFESENQNNNTLWEEGEFVPAENIPGVRSRVSRKAEPSDDKRIDLNSRTGIPKFPVLKHRVLKNPSWRRS